METNTTQRAGMLSHPVHGVMVTGGGPFGRAWMDCPCGEARIFASKHAATLAGLSHYAREVPEAEWPDAHRDLLTKHREPSQTA